MKTKQERDLMEAFLKICGELGEDCRTIVPKEEDINIHDYRSGYIKALIDISKGMIKHTNLE